MHEVPEELNRVTEAVIGAAIEVHRQLGPGFLEATYHRAMEIELELRGVLFDSETPVSLSYKGQPIGEGRLDLLVSEAVVVELKAVDSLAPIHHAQVISYLKATGHTLGLLVNFNVEVLRDGLKRVVFTQSDLPSSASSAPLR
ncbi:MAG: GxxExxY protein [Phycisphaerales bacterium JB063]